MYLYIHRLKLVDEDNEKTQNNKKLSILFLNILITIFKLWKFQYIWRSYVVLERFLL